MTEIVATNISAIQFPEQWPTATPTALANNTEMLDILQQNKILYIKSKICTPLCNVYTTFVNNVQPYTTM